MYVNGQLSLSLFLPDQRISLSLSVQPSPLLLLVPLMGVSFHSPMP